MDAQTLRSPGFLVRGRSGEHRLGVLKYGSEPGRHDTGLGRQCESAIGRRYFGGLKVERPAWPDGFERLTEPREAADGLLGGDTGNEPEYLYFLLRKRERSSVHEDPPVAGERSDA